MSQILNCGLDQRTLTILAGLIENGVNPEALAAVVKELKRETEALKACNLPRDWKFRSHRLWPQQALRKRIVDFEDTPF